MLPYGISTWYTSSSAVDSRALQRVISPAQMIIGCSLPSLEEAFRQKLQAHHSTDKQTLEQLLPQCNKRTEHCPTLTLYTAV
ncbi:hypothetical protein AOLI_G00068000 [Acnodon oligacanthus]